jgi:hypothetical protein
MTIRLTGLALVAALGATGCSTHFTDHAPAKDASSMYVTGSKANFIGSSPAIWQCPVAGGDCKRLKVEEENR